MPKLAALMDKAETDVLAYMGFPVQHRAKLHSTDALDKLRVVSSLLFSRAYAGSGSGCRLRLRARSAFGFSDQALTNRV